MGRENRKATETEIDKMRELARQAMLDGAFGLSTGLFYVPGNYAPLDEVIELARVAGEFGGIHQSHMKDEAARVLDSVRDTIAIGERGGLPTQVTHHQIIGQANWGKSADTLRLIDEGKRVIEYLAGARVPMPKTTANYLRRCDSFRDCRCA